MPVLIPPARGCLLYLHTFRTIADGNLILDEACASPSVKQNRRKSLGLLCNQGWQNNNATEGAAHGVLMELSSRTRYFETTNFTASRGPKRSWK